MQEIKVIRRLQGFSDPQLAQLAIDLDLTPQVERMGLIFQIAKQVVSIGKWPDVLVGVVEPKYPRVEHREWPVPPKPPRVDPDILARNLERSLAKLVDERREQAAFVAAIRSINECVDRDARLKQARERWIATGFKAQRDLNLQRYLAVRKRIRTRGLVLPVKDTSYSTCRICRRRSSKLVNFVCPFCS
jgi:hypothetical protein